MRQPTNMPKMSQVSPCSPSISSEGSHNGAPARAPPSRATRRATRPGVVATSWSAIALNCANVTGWLNHESETNRNHWTGAAGYLQRLPRRKRRVRRRWFCSKPPATRWRRCRISGAGAAIPPMRVLIRGLVTLPAGSAGAARPAPSIRSARDGGLVCGSRGLSSKPNRTGASFPITDDSGTIVDCLHVAGGGGARRDGAPAHPGALAGTSRRRGSAALGDGRWRGLTG